MLKLFTQTLDTLRGALDAIRNQAGNMEARASVLRDLHWGEEEALKRLLPLCTEAGDLAMATRVLQDATASCGTLAGLEALAARVQDLRARILFLEEGIIQEEEEARGRMQAVIARLQ